VEDHLTTLLSGFDDNPFIARRALRDMFELDRLSFQTSAIDYLKNSPPNRAQQFLLSMLVSEHLLLEAICDPAKTSVDDAIAIVRNASQTYRSLDSELAALITREASHLSVQRAARVLEILSELVPNARTQPVIELLLQHPHSHVRSKAALVIGKWTQSPEWVLQVLQHPDARFRANAVESLWDAAGDAYLALFQAAALDPNCRTVGNALYGLYRLGDRSAIAGIVEMAGRSDAAFRATAAWVMGQTGDPRFLPVLQRLWTTETGSVRQGALRAIRKVQQRRSELLAKPPLCVTVRQIPGRRPRRSRFRVTVRDSSGLSVEQLPVTAFLLREADKSIHEYACERHQLAEPLLLGIAMPRRRDNAELRDRASEEAGLRCLTQMRPRDTWIVVKYLDEAERLKTDGDVVLGRRHASISRDPKSLAEAIKHPVARADAARGLLAAIRELLHVLSARLGSRHILVLDSGVQPEQEMADLAQLATAQNTVIHAVGSSPVLGQLCAATGGVFSEATSNEGMAEAAEETYSSILSHYELEFAAPSSVVEIEVWSEAGHGHAVFDPASAAVVKPTRA
jgi:hypothetical protein